MSTRAAHEYGTPEVMERLTHGTHAPGLGLDASIAASRNTRSLRPRHVGHVLEWTRTACAVCAFGVQCVVLVVLLTR